MSASALVRRSRLYQLTVIGEAEPPERFDILKWYARCGQAPQTAAARWRGDRVR